MESNAKQDARAPKPQATENALSEKDLAKIAGGFNPQPDPPGIVAKLVLPAQFGIR
jgi:hypothetical protein